jgi:ElaB/YqjD/DUF883 family membrane-anchored ribosome-binding protein
MASAPENQLKDDLATIKADIASLSGAIETLVSEGARVRAAMAKTAKRSARNASAAGSDILDNTWNLGEDTAAAASNVVQTGVSMVEEQVKKNPLGLALIALGIGFSIGLFRFR